MKSIRSFPKQAFLMNQNFYQDDRPDGWNPGEQHKVFLELLKISDLSNKSFEKTSVLDVGCGTGKLLSILARNGINRYVGIDILESAIEEAKRTHANLASVDTEFQVQDPLTWKTEEQFDFVFASGALSLNLESVGVDNYDFIKEMIGKMWSWTRIGLVFNFLSATKPNHGTELFFYDKTKVIHICNEIISNEGSITTSIIQLSDLETCTLFVVKNTIHSMAASGEI